MNEETFYKYATCRSPHGERGLKCYTRKFYVYVTFVALLMESVD